MSDDTPPVTPSSNELPTLSSPALRREALLPNERSRGLGTVAVVCTMAGVASGLALATTLMAMQVADTMALRTCSYRTVDVSPLDIRTDHGFLGIKYVFTRGTAQVDSVLPGTPAEAIGIMPGDHVLAVNGDRIDSENELQDRIFTARPGSRPSIVIRRQGREHLVHPTLINRPTITY